MTPVYEPWNAGRGAEIIAEHSKLEGATLVILHALQEAFGYVPEPAIPMIASALNLSRAEVHGVFTFYHDFMREPAGRRWRCARRARGSKAWNCDRKHDGRRASDAGADLLPRPLRNGAVGDAGRPRGRPARRSAHRRAGCGGAAMTMRVFVSRDAGAVAVGADEVVLALEQAAAKRGVAIEIVRTGSRGLYWLEPMIEVATVQGRVAFGPVSESDVASVLDAMVADGPHALRLGVTEEIPWLKRQSRLTFARCGVIDPRSVEDYRAHSGYKGLERALMLNSDAILADVTTSGLRGRGGAGFPTGIKWKTVAQTSADRKYIVCNADEGDSGTFADRMIMEGDPFVVIEGMTIAAVAVGATKGYIYIRSEYPHAVVAMKAAISAAERAGYLGPRIGGSNHDFDLEVRVGAGAYVCGEETSLLESLEGRRGIVRAKPALPAHKGLFGRPTVSNN